MVNKCAPHFVKDDRCVWTDEHGHGSASTCWPCATFRVDSKVRGDDEGISAIPALRLHPVDRVEECIGGAVARIDGSDAFDIVITAFSE